MCVNKYKISHDQECSEMKGYNTTDFIRQLGITSWSVQCVLKFPSIDSVSYIWLEYMQIQNKKIDWISFCVFMSPRCSFTYLPLTSISYLGCGCPSYSHLLYFRTTWGCVLSPMCNILSSLFVLIILCDCGKSRSPLRLVGFSPLCFYSTWIGRKKRSCLVLCCGEPALSMPDDCKTRLDHHWIRLPQDLLK